MIQIKDTSGNIVKRLVYDIDGRIIKDIDANGYQSGIDDTSRYGTLYKYNFAGWLTDKRIPLKQENGIIYYNVTKYIYDKTGKLQEEWKSPQYVTQTGEPAIWNIIIYTYYKNGRVKTISDNTGAYIEYTYDAVGNTTQEKAKINDNQYSIKGYQYNSLGKLDKQWIEVNADDLAAGGIGIVNAETSIEYGKNGNIKKVASP